MVKLLIGTVGNDADLYRFYVAKSSGFLNAGRPRLPRVLYVCGKRAGRIRFKAGFHPSFGFDAAAMAWFPPPAV